MEIDGLMVFAMENRLCCLIKPAGRCENCGALFCDRCNEKRSMNWDECFVSGKNTGKTPDNHWVTEEAI